MELGLEFKDLHIEKEFRNSQLKVHQRSFLILTVVLLIQSTGIFFSNPFDLNIFENKFILTYVFGMGAVIFGYLFIKAKFPTHSDKGILLFMFSFIIFATEFFEMIQTTITSTAWVYFILGVYMQTGCLILLISQVRWTHSLLLLTGTQIYYWIRVINIINNTGAQKSAIISLIIHILLFFIITYTNEKQIRMCFLKSRADNQQLSSLDEIIKGVIESAIFIIKDDEVLFINEATKKILDIQHKDEVIDVLQMIKIVFKEGIFQESSSSAYADNLKANRGNSWTLYKHYKLIELQAKTTRMNLGLHDLEGEIQLLAEDFKSYSIQIGSTYWKGNNSIIFIINDVSSIKNHFKTLNNYKDNLLATVSHDLRTPLNGILGMLEVLYEETDEKSKKEKLQITITSAKLLLNMINDILDFSLISKGRLRLKFDKTNISALVEDTKSIMTLQARLKNLKLDVENYLLGSENYLVDGNRLRQVLLNLIGNAIKYTSEGQVKIRVYEENLKERINQQEIKSLKLKPSQFRNSIDIKEESIYNSMKISNCFNYEQNSNIFSSMCLDRKRIFFEVEDTGIGIKPEEIRNLFKLFSRTTSGHDRNMNGIGLGLAISQSLVRLMNSNRPGALIEVTSEYGKGSKFRFPIYIDNDPSEAFKEVEDKSMNSPPRFEVKPQNLRRLDEFPALVRIDSGTELLINNRPNKRTLMIVDDDQINILVARTYLEPLTEEFKYVTAENGKIALEKVKNFALNSQFFDVFLMDCNMPEMDGFEASQKLKLMMNNKEIPWAPIVAITANVASTDKEKCFKSGMDIFLTKPYTKTQLLKALNDAIDLKNDRSL